MDVYLRWLTQFDVCSFYIPYQAILHQHTCISILVMLLVFACYIGSNENVVHAIDHRFGPPISFPYLCHSFHSIDPQIIIIIRCSYIYVAMCPPVAVLF
jgi:hypothetical protein